MTSAAFWTKLSKKDDIVKEVRKYKKKKRFGESVNERAPAAQSAVIERKMLQYGGTYLETDTKSMKAS